VPDLHPEPLSSAGEGSHLAPWPDPWVAEPWRWVAGAGGVPLAVYHFGGPGPEIFALHATGLCAACLEPLATTLGDRASLVAMDARAHGRSGRPADGDLRWERSAEDVLAVLEATGLDSPVGFGHSFGGAVLVLAEAAHPGRFGGLVLYEPVVPPLAEPVAGGVPDNRLSVGARRRRRRFGSRQEALANFAAKPPFAGVDRRALARYVDNGFAPSSDGQLELRCRPEDEAEIYALGFAHRAWQLLPEVRCPVTLVCGELTDAFGPDALRAMARRLPDAEVVVLPGLGHFGPLEDPPTVGRVILDSRAWRVGQARP
jgi:pimeloyl-ACP methyl ester carboxylesterase